MPAESQKQRAFLYATKGAAWVKKHHFDNPGKLPTYVDKNKKLHQAAVDSMRRQHGTN
jgi:hypothetical protein